MSYTLVKAEPKDSKSNESNQTFSKTITHLTPKKSKMWFEVSVNCVVFEEAHSNNPESTVIDLTPGNVYVLIFHLLGHNEILYHKYNAVQAVHFMGLIKSLEYTFKIIQQLQTVKDVYYDLENQSLPIIAERTFNDQKAYVNRKVRNLMIRSNVQTYAKLSSAAKKGIDDKVGIIIQNAIKHWPSLSKVELKVCLSAATIRATTKLKQQNPQLNVMTQWNPLEDEVPKESSDDLPFKSPQSHVHNELPTSSTAAWNSTEYKIPVVTFTNSLDTCMEPSSSSSLLSVSPKPDLPSNRSPCVYPYSSDNDERPKQNPRSSEIRTSRNPYPTSKQRHHKNHKNRNPSSFNSTSSRRSGTKCHSGFSGLPFGANGNNGNDFRHSTNESRSMNYYYHS